MLIPTGFIGRPVADAFVRAGHIVYGQTRSAETARELAKDEILPVVCDPMTAEGGAIWAKVAGQADVGMSHPGLASLIKLTSTVVDVLKGAGADAAKQTFQRFLSSVSHRPPGAPKATYIYTSGLWYMSRGHGGLDKWSDERQPSSDYNGAVQWRGEIENAVLQGTWQDQFWLL